MTHQSLKLLIENISEISDHTPVDTLFYMELLSNSPEVAMQRLVTSIFFSIAKDKHISIEYTEHDKNIRFDPHGDKSLSSRIEMLFYPDVAIATSFAIRIIVGPECRIYDGKKFIEDIKALSKILGTKVDIIG